MQELIDALEQDNAVARRYAVRRNVIDLEMSPQWVANDLKLKKLHSVDSGGFARFLNSLGQIGLSKLAVFSTRESL